MSSESNARRVYLACGCTDLLKSIDGLAALVKEGSNLDPFSPCLSTFCNRERDKILEWGRNGFWLCYRRLERWRFRWPAGHAQGLSHQGVVAGDSSPIGLTVFRPLTAPCALDAYKQMLTTARSPSARRCGQVISSHFASGYPVERLVSPLELIPLRTIGVRSQSHQLHETRFGWPYYVIVICQAPASRERLPHRRSDVAFTECYDQVYSYSGFALRVLDAILSQALALGCFSLISHLTPLGAIPCLLN